ncbi:TlpA family protein disulfide reductase [Legionella spiritensis]|uniref:Thiol-disulfide oxidoreductase ResA n=1 Tax=Legionella spiritensis TaxID=452 RepID=A0A0W0ZA51_LEGSP|nr:TlpA disulfide reductase family protein [Legionella spiritensis]KTD65997.1 thiol-disulfide oxidoreductase ResA [Legionella spiritensis]SNV23518.1 thiol-disulfide oxidoreductase [Legionella spiritensis]
MAFFKRLPLLLLFLAFNTAIHAGVTLTDIDGRRISFAALQGKWVFINYWASWCQPCLDEIKELNRFYQNRKRKVALFAVNYDALPVPEQMKLIKQYGITYPSLRQDPGNVLHLGDIRGVPATFVFNPQGQWVTTLYGGQTLDSLDEAMTENRNQGTE